MKANPVLICLLAFVSATVSIHRSSAAPPVVNDVTPRGLQLGATTTITIRGQQLESPVGILIGGLKFEAALRADANAQQAQFDVTVPSDAQPGVYPCWFIGANGSSSATPLTVLPLGLQPFEATIASRPVALYGSVEGGTILTTKLEGVQGERVALEIESRRLGSNLRPVIRLFNPKGTQIAWSQGEDRLEGDGRCEAILPEDGEYTIQVHDLLYKGQAPGYFVLKVGDLATADLVYPLGIQRGTQRSVRFLLGSLAGQTSDVSIPADSLHDTRPIIPSVTGFAGLVPHVQVSGMPEFIEEEVTSADSSPPVAPVGITGILSKPSERDRYTVTVTANAKLRFEVFAQRLGSPLDGILVVRRENGQELGRSDDQSATADPAVDITIPADVEKVQVEIHDLIDAGGDAYVYRLAVTDVTRPRFALDVETDQITVPAGGATVVKVTARRSSYDGPIDLALDGLPEGVRVTGHQIPAGSDVAQVVLATNTTVPPTTFRLRGTGLQGEVAIHELALVPDRFRSQARPWFRESLSLANGPALPIHVTWNAVEKDFLRLGSQQAVALRVTKAEGTAGKVRVRLQTTQPMPRKKVKEGNEEKEVDDVERALRLASDPVVEGVDTDVAASILVPADLAERTWGLYFVAELLSADEKTVLATAVSDARLIPAKKE